MDKEDYEVTLAMDTTKGYPITFWQWIKWKITGRYPKFKEIDEESEASR